MAKRERMSNIDTAWLRMEHPTNLMMITGVMIFEEKLDIERLKQTFTTRFLSYRRFRQRPVRTPGPAFWETDPYFDIDRHLHRIALPGAAGKQELEDLASDLMSTPLDFSKPLWQVHLVEDYQDGSAIILRIHHCYADGIALIYVLLSMTDTAPDAAKSARPRFDDRDAENDILKRLFKPVNRAVDNIFKVGHGLWQYGLELLSRPSRIADYARRGVDMAGEVVQLAALPNDPPTRFKGKLGVSKRVAWAEPLPLAEVKAVSRVLGCSINDVLLACVAGALRAYLLERGDAVDGLEIRGAIPVNLRPLEQAKNLGNFFGLVLLKLPIGIENPLERLYRLRRYMEDLKQSYQAVVSFGLLGILGMAPGQVQRPALDLLSKKSSAVMTNVPGPREAIYLAGAKLGEMMFWVPQSGEIGLGVSILSYNNRVQFGLVTDINLVSDPQTIIDRFADEFEKLLLATLLQPWDEPADPQTAETLLKT